LPTGSFVIYFASNASLARCRDALEFAIAKGIARNLFYLSRFVELSNGDTELAAGIATEIDLAWLWWRYGGGRAEDDGRFARLKLLRAIGTQNILNPGRATYLVDDLDSSIVASLLRFDSLQEDIKGATVSYRHDVLRDWSVGFLLHESRRGGGYRCHRHFTVEAN
jgi:hypothetical protein